MSLGENALLDELLRAGVTHAKLSFVGVQEKPVLTLVWLSEAASLSPSTVANLTASRTDPAVIGAFARAVPRSISDNDRLPATRYFRVSAGEMASMVQHAAPLLRESPPKPAAALLSFTLVAQAGKRAIGAVHPIAFEQAGALYRALIDGLAVGNAPARGALERHALDTGSFRRWGQ